MPHAPRRAGEIAGPAKIDDPGAPLLTAAEERHLLGSLAECTARLAEGLDSPRGAGGSAPGDADPKALARSIAEFYSRPAAPLSDPLGATFRRYCELRRTLVLANMRLVAHIAGRYRARGIARSDLIQDGVCGLLEAIDRFDLARQTRLVTYANWWIRQAMQRAVSEGAYPVRLSPRHLRQLSENQGALGRGAAGEGASEMIRRIHAATRPAVSLDATSEEGGFRLIDAVSDPEGDRTGEVAAEDAIERLFGMLRPREQQVLSLRFGLGGGARLSLSQVGRAMQVSKERIRQIEEMALGKIRAFAAEHELQGLAPA